MSSHSDMHVERAAKAALEFALTAQARSNAQPEHSAILARMRGPAKA